MRLASLLLLQLGMMIFALSAEAQPQNTLPRFEPIEEGTPFPVSVPEAFEATRGWLVVAEDRSSETLREIRLPVAIVRSRTKKKHDPVVYLAGGPGVSAMNAAAYPGAYPWTAERDFIVMGQRGTHDSHPALMCPEFRKAVAAGEDQARAVTECRERLAASGIGLQHYHSLSSADDLEDLRQALGIETWNLYGTSYGTRLALVYARQYGDAVRAMVLDSPLPPNAIYDDQSDINFENALRAIAADCATQSICRTAFPDLEKRFFATVEAVSDNPIRLDGIDDAITGAELAASVSISSAEDVRRAPQRMDKVARLDPAIFEGWQTEGWASDFAWGMRLSVWCREALPFSRRSQRDGPGTALGGYESAAIQPALCEAWHVPPLEGDFVAAVVSDVPTLILAGQFDPLTPPIWGHLAARTLSNSRVISVRGEAHLPTQQWSGDGCAMSVAAAFIRHPDPSTRVDACLSGREAPEYLLPQD